MPTIRSGFDRCAASIRVVLALVLLLALLQVEAKPISLSDEYLLDRWTNARGLPVNGTTDIHLGQKGYLWLATFDGLVRFDGYRFRTFNASSHPGLPGNRLTRLIQQGSDLIWVLTEQYALASFDGHRFHAAGADQGLPADRVLKLHLDNLNRLWIGTESGLAISCGSTCFHEVSAPSLDGHAVQAFANAPSGDIWVGTGAGNVLRVAPDGVREVVDASDGLGLDDVRALLVDGNGIVWAGGEGGMARIESGRAEMLQTFNEAVINDVESAPGGDLIAQSYERTYRLAEGRWRIVNDGPIAGYVRLVAEGPQGFEWRVRQSELLREGRSVVRASCPIRDFEFDSTGSVWLATMCDGLWRISRRQFQTIGEDRGLPEGPVYGLIQDEMGSLWASVDSGLVAEIRNLRLHALHQAGSTGQVVGTVARDGDGQIWVGKGSLCRMTDAGCERPDGLPEALHKGLVRSIFEDGQGGLWVGGRAGLWRRLDGRWQDMQGGLALPDWVQVQVIMEARSGNLWFGTDSSGLRRRSVSGVVDEFDSAQGLTSDRIRDLHQDEQGRLWVVTADSGLCRSDRAESAPQPLFTCLGEREGLHSDSLHRLLPDGQGRYWFNSNSGVFWVHQQALKRVLEGRANRVYPRVYTESDGLLDREGNGGVQNAGIRLFDGRLAFPGQGGIAVFDPDSVRELQGAPRVIIELLRLANGTRLPAGDRVRLPLGERVFAVQIAGIKPGLTGEVYFRYRFDGGSWVEVGEDRNLGFDNVRPGRHTLEIAAVDADSGLSGPVAAMAIEVPPHLHERLSFRIAIAGAIVLLAAIWLGRRHRAAVRLQQYLHREVERRTSQALRHQRRADAAVAVAGERFESKDDSATASEADSGTEQPLLADDVREWIERNVQRSSLSVAALAESMHMSRSKLHRRLVTETGRSPGEFIRDVRLGLARQMLQGSGKTVSDVAYSVGFSSVSGFSRAYRNHFGESPSETERE
jgi:ligand-binding sensor domain-containing protein/AraC-like DNA-binding protein